MGERQVALILLLIVCIVFVTLPQIASVGASSTMWTQTYGGDDREAASSVIQTSDGDFAMVGFTRTFSAGDDEDFWLVKTDSFGAVEWNRTYGGTGWERAESVVQTYDGGYAIVGHSTGNVWFVKADSHGNMQWNQTYKGTESSFAKSVVQASDGGYAIAANTNFTPGGASAHVWLIKTDSEGNIEWNKTLGGGDPSSVIQTNDGGYAMGGYVDANMPNFLLVKTDSEGNKQWSKNYGGDGKDVAFSVVQSKDGGYALTGWTYSFGGGGSNIWLVKTDSVGNVEWNKTYGGGSAWSMVYTSDGGYALAGTKLVKTDSEGNIQWSQTFGGTQDQVNSLIQSSDGGYALAGSAHFGAGESDFWLIKTNEYGVIPEFPSWIILPLFLTTTLVLLIYRKTINKMMVNCGNFL